jgi:hypothetical protein
MTPEQKAAYFTQLENSGRERVKSDLDHGRIPPGFVNPASEWLASKEAEAERRQEASQAEQMSLMRRASEAAEAQASEARRANTRATIALVIAIISITVSAIGIWLPFWTGHK